MQKYICSSDLLIRYSTLKKFIGFQGFFAVMNPIILDQKYEPSDKRRYWVCEKDGELYSGELRAAIGPVLMKSGLYEFNNDEKRCYSMCKYGGV